MTSNSQSATAAVPLEWKTRIFSYFLFWLDLVIGSSTTHHTTKQHCLLARPFLHEGSSALPTCWQAKLLPLAYVLSFPSNMQGLDLSTALMKRSPWGLLGQVNDEIENPSWPWSSLDSSTSKSIPFLSKSQGDCMLLLLDPSEFVQTRRYTAGAEMICICSVWSTAGQFFERKPWVYGLEKLSRVVARKRCDHFRSFRHHQAFHGASRERAIWSMLDLRGFQSSSGLGLKARFYFDGELKTSWPQLTACIPCTNGVGIARNCPSPSLRAWI